MKYEREGCSFEIVDKPTVRQQMEYFSAGAGLPLALRNWECAKALITKWECSIFPDYKANLNSVTDPTITTFLIWAGGEVVKFMNKLDEIPKN